jgi:phage I-like protein
VAFHLFRSTHTLLARAINSDAHLAGSLGRCAADSAASVARSAFSSASAAFAIETHRGAGAPEWITLIPASNFKGFDGRGPYRLDQPGHVVAATEQMIARHMTAGLPLDFDHATDFAAPEGRQAPAAGWIKQVRAVNGAIQGRIEWTPKGRDAVEAHEYRYVSPVFEYDDEGRVVRLLRAALTNNPNLNLPAISFAFPRGSDVAAPVSRSLISDDGDEDMRFSADEIRLIAVMARKGKPLHETVKSLMEALPGVHPHKILDMAKLAVNPEDADGDGDAHDTDAAADANADGDAESAEDLDQRSHAERAGDSAKRKLDAAVAQHPMVLSLNRALNDMRGERAKEKAERMVDDAIRAGKLIPAQREWAVTYCTADLTGFQKFIGAQPALSLDDKGSPIGVRHAPPVPGDVLTPAELAVCAQTRCTPQEYLKRKQYIAARITGVAAQATMLRIEVGSAA